MKKILIAIVAIAGTALGQTARAADGQINFTGSIQGATCTIDVNGTVTPAVASVALQAVSANRLTAAAQVAGATSFTIGLKNCIGSVSAAAFFESGATVEPIWGNLRNTATTGAATNVLLQLLDGTSGLAIRAGNTSQNTGNTRVTLDAAGNATLPYVVQYFATGAATAGAVSSSVAYSINYL